MNSSWKSIAGNVILGTLIAFAYGGYCIHDGMQDAALAQNETSISVHVHKSGSLGLILCGYSYGENGYTTFVEGKCPDQISTDSVKGALVDVADLPEDFTATMYLNPADPSTRSYTDYGAKSESEYQRAKLSIGVGVIIIVLFVLGTVFASKPSKSAEGIVVDNKGTVIYPDKMNSGQPEVPHYSYQDVSFEERPDRTEND
jgi:hypothetical protein